MTIKHTVEHFLLSKFDFFIFYFLFFIFYFIFIFIFYFLFLFFIFIFYFFQFQFLILFKKIRNLLFLKAYFHFAILLSTILLFRNTLEGFMLLPLLYYSPTLIHSTISFMPTFHTHLPTLVQSSLLLFFFYFFLFFFIFFYFFVFFVFNFMFFLKWKVGLLRFHFTRTK